jgi:hypothetical protein
MPTTFKQFIDKNGNTWSWEESPETIKALRKLAESSKVVNTLSHK